MTVYGEFWLAVDRYAITSSTLPKWEGKNEQGLGQQIVRGHAYYVRGVDMSNHPPTITLVNPWGSNGGALHLVTLTQEQWRDYFDRVTYARVGS